jgi:hypothetical protein
MAMNGAEPKEMLLSIRAPIGRRRPGRTIAIVDEEWRVCIALDEVPRAKRKSRMKSLVTALRARLGDQASISSGNERIFIYTTTAASAAAIAQEARDVLAQQDVASPGWVRTEVWLPIVERWRDGTAAGTCSPGRTAKRTAWDSLDATPTTPCSCGTSGSASALVGR